MSSIRKVLVLLVLLALIIPSAGYVAGGIAMPSHANAAVHVTGAVSVTNVSVDLPCTSTTVTGVVTLSGPFTGTVSLVGMSNIPSQQFQPTGGTVDVNFVNATSATYSLDLNAVDGAHAYRVDVQGSNPTINGLTTKSVSFECSFTPTATPTATETTVPTETATVVPTETATVTPTETETSVPTATDTAVAPTATSTGTTAPTASATAAATSTGTSVPTATSTATTVVAPTATNTATATETNTAVPPTSTPTATNTAVAPSATPTTPGANLSGGGAPTATATARPTATNTPRPTATSTPRPTATNTPRPTATRTATPRPTNTATNTPTPRPTLSGGGAPQTCPQACATATPTPCGCASPTPTPTVCHTATPTPMRTGGTAPTATATPRATSTPMAIATARPTATATPRPVTRHPSTGRASVVIRPAFAPVTAASYANPATYATMRIGGHTYAVKPAAYPTILLQNVFTVDSDYQNLGRSGLTYTFAHDDLQAGIGRSLYGLHRGDVIFVQRGSHHYRYVVTSNVTVAPNNVAALTRHYSRSTLVLVTCTPVGVDTSRVVVTAQLR